MARFPTCSLLFAVCSFFLQQRVVISIRVGDYEVANLLPCADICVKCNEPGVAYMIVRNQTSSQIAGELVRKGAVALATAYTPGLKEGAAIVAEWAPIVGQEAAQYLEEQAVGAAYGMAMHSGEDAVQGRKLLKGMHVSCDEVVIVATAKASYLVDKNVAVTLGHNKGIAKQFPIVSYHYIPPQERQGNKELIPGYDIWRYALDDIRSKEMQMDGQNMFARTGAWIASANPLPKQEIPQIANNLLDRGLCQPHQGLAYAWGSSHVESLGSGISRMFTSMVARDDRASSADLVNGVKWCLDPNNEQGPAK